MELNHQRRTLHKLERLYKKTELESLFSKGKKYTKFPVTVIIADSAEQLDYHKVVFIASKRIFPKATQRNKVKRLMREIYRLNKIPVLHGKNYYIGISAHRNYNNFHTLQKAYISCIKKVLSHA